MVMKLMPGFYDEWGHWNPPYEMDDGTVAETRPMPGTDTGNPELDALLNEGEDGGDTTSGYPPKPTYPPPGGYEWELFTNTYGDTTWIPGKPGITVISMTPSGDPVTIGGVRYQFHNIKYSDGTFKQYEEVLGAEPEFHMDEASANAEAERRNMASGTPGYWKPYQDTTTGDWDVKADPTYKSPAIPSPSGFQEKLMGDPFSAEVARIKTTAEGGKVDPDTGEIWVPDGKGGYVGTRDFDPATVASLKEDALIKARGNTIEEVGTGTWGDDGYEIMNVTEIDPYGNAVKTFQRAGARYNASKDLAAIERKRLSDQAQRNTEAELNYRREQDALAMEEVRKTRQASLAARPISWLEYAMSRKEPAAVQPWMLPLMPQQYGITKAGEKIPGPTWEQEDPNLKKLPELTTPSAQYFARMGQQGQQQYMGYEQARTGATPEMTDWRLWSQAPPSGRNPTMTRTR